MDEPGWPSARVRLLRRTAAPAAPSREDVITVWLDGSRLRLRDDSGRPFPDVLEEVTSPRGFGRATRSLEDLMGAWTPAPTAPRPTDILVDRGSDQTVVSEGGGEPWRIPVGSTDALADLVLTRGRERSLDPVGHEQLLGRDCLDYRFRLEGDEETIPFATEVRWLVAGPYLLRRELRDADNPGRWLTSEVVELVEGDTSMPEVGDVPA